MAELVSELLYAGKTLQEIAGYDNYQLLWVLFRKRDKYGRLIRVDSELPPWVKVDANGMRVVGKRVSFGAMYKQVKRTQGLSKEEADKKWKDYLETNPGAEDIRKRFRER